jgi:hypothetical protein
VLLLFVGLALACASNAPEKHAKNAAATVGSDAASDAGFPPTGPIVLRATPAPAEGTLYRLLSSYDGRTEVSEEGHDDATGAEELWSLQLDYRQLPVQAPDDSLASSLVLEALKRRAMMRPPGKQNVLEIGDDRVRVSNDDKVATDLRGAQPKEDLTPRSLIGKSFAMLVTTPLGDPKGFTMRGVPSAKKLLASLVLREPLAYVQVSFPEHPVAAGETWHGKRYFPNPIGRLGLGVEIEYRLVGFEKIAETPCAHVSLRAALDEKDVQGDSGMKFEEVRYSLAGDAWLDLRSGQTVLLRVEDVVAAAHTSTAASQAPKRARMRYNGRSALQRLDVMPTETTWADGTKRFSAVK